MPGTPPSALSDNVTVYNPIAKNDRVLRIALACIGLRSPRIVRIVTGATLSYATEPRSFEDNVTHTPISSKHDATVLAALEPRAHIEVGSLAHALPSTIWTTDDGARIIFFPDDQVSVLQKPVLVKRPWRVNTGKSTALPRGPFVLPVAPMSIPGVFTIGHTRVSKQVRKVEGLWLKNGDAVLDIRGTLWYFVGGRLQDRLVATLTSQEYTVRGTMIIPHLSTPKRDDYVPNALYEVTITNAQGQRGTSYPCRALSQESETWGWRMEGQGSVVSAKFICMDPDGAVKLDQTQDTCASSGGTWDRPCTTDNDCPYYDPRRARGGCTQSGFCELPLGMTASSYRTANVRNLLLRGCSPDDPSYPWCTNQPLANARFETHKRV